MSFQHNAAGLQVSGAFNYQGTNRDAVSDFGINDCAILAECAGADPQGNPIQGVLGILANCDAGCGLVGIHGPYAPQFNANWKIGLKNNPTGVLGVSNAGPGVHGFSTGGDSFTYGGSTGVFGEGTDIGVYGESPNTGVRGFGANDGFGVEGQADFGIGVVGHAGFFERDKEEVGVLGEAVAGGWGVWGNSSRVDGIAGVFTNYRFRSAGRLGPVYPVAGEAAYFHGSVQVAGFLSKSGGGFKIDHPRDPKNKYLCHSFVESPDMKNIYDGISTLDKRGRATIKLPDWFGALNKDFRYQLTAVGAPAPNLHILKEISQNRFVIGGGGSMVKVAWQVTGIRKDAWADRNRLRVEEIKRGKERGAFLHPELHGESIMKSTLAARFPKQMKRLLKRNRGRKVRNGAQIAQRKK